MFSGENSAEQTKYSALNGETERKEEGDLESGPCPERAPVGRFLGVGEASEHENWDTYYSGFSFSVLCAHLCHYFKPSVHVSYIHLSCVCGTLGNSGVSNERKCCLLESCGLAC